jgi:hypothetical protein
MSTKKLTLSADRKVIEEAKKLAKSRHTTVSRMFSRLLHAMAHPEGSASSDLGPLTEEMTGIVRLGRKGHRKVLEDALADKYRLKR